MKRFLSIVGSFCLYYVIFAYVPSPADWIIVLALIILEFILNDFLKSRVEKAQLDSYVQIRERAIERENNPPPVSQPVYSAPKPAPVKPKNEIINSIPDSIGNLMLAYSYEDVEVYSEGNTLNRFCAAPGFSRVDFAEDHSFPEDPEAVGIYYDGRVIGWMYKNKLRDMVRDYMKDKDRRFIGVTKPFDRNAGEKPIIGLYFYAPATRRLNAMMDKGEFKEFTLTGNRSSDTQDTIELCYEGEPVEIVFDSYSERYEADLEGDVFIGNFPRSAYKFLESLKHYEAAISEIEEEDSDDDNGKRTVTVMVVKLDDRESDDE